MSYSSWFSVLHFCIAVVTERKQHASMSRKLQKFLILLDNESLLYFPGSFLSGRVLVELEEELPVTGKSYRL